MPVRLSPDHFYSVDNNVVNIITMEDDDILYRVSGICADAFVRLAKSESLEAIIDNLLKDHKNLKKDEISSFLNKFQTDMLNKNILEEA